MIDDPLVKRVVKWEIKLAIRRLFPVQDFSMDLFVLTPGEFERQKNVVSTVGRTAFKEGVVFPHPFPSPDGRGEAPRIRAAQG